MNMYAYAKVMKNQLDEQEKRRLINFRQGNKARPPLYMIVLRHIKKQSLIYFRQGNKARPSLYMTVLDHIKSTVLYILEKETKYGHLFI